MSWLSRFTNAFRSDRVNREIDEELESHLQEAVEAGRDPEEARRAFGSPLRQREASRDVRMIAWLDSLRSDVVFGWRQLNKKKVTSDAAILSLGLALGACTAAFRLVDAFLWRPLPIEQPQRLYAFGFKERGEDGLLHIGQSSTYAMFRQMQAAVDGQAELIGNDYVVPQDLTYASDREMEKAYLQHVSGVMFDSFGLRPAAGRLLAASDDVTPGASAVAVLSYDYWTRRFGRDPKAMGRSFRYRGDVYTIIGVAGKGFTGTETGRMVDVFVPVMMNTRAVGDAHWNWLRTLVRLKPGVAAEPVRERLQVVLQAFRDEEVKGFAGLP
jgi:putative ABC transport system permease protein